MRPLSIAERSEEPTRVSLGALLGGGRPKRTGRTGWSLEGYVEEILRSGFPGLRGLSGRARRAQLDGYIERVLDRDFPDLGHPVRNPEGLRRWLTAYAAATATTATFEKIRDAATGGEGEKPSKTATLPYRAVLERLWILDPLPAWAPTRSHIRRLTLPPKHHLADPALAARLLGVDAKTLLSGHEIGPPMPRDGTLLGALFESLVTLSVRVYAQAAESRVLHLRTGGGEHEIDLIVERPGGRVVAIEVKLARDADDPDTAHMRWLRDIIGEDLLDAVVITTGREAYRRRDGIGVVPAALLGP
jgi:predicted AAA+ superfamily ATPase